MGGGDLNTKKSWHPSTLKNQERVWKAEQAAAEEKKRIIELQREREQEHDRSQLNEMAQRNFGTGGEGGTHHAADNRLHWMYDKPDKQVQHEDYLLGKEIGKTEQLGNTQLNAIPAVSRRVVGSSMTKTLDDTQVDLARKMREDPLLLVKERERAARAALLNNPLQRKRLADLLRSEQEQKQSKQKNKKKSAKKDNLDDILAAKLNALGGEKGIDLSSLLNSNESSSDQSESSDEKTKKKKKKEKNKKKTKKSKKKKSHKDSQLDSDDNENYTKIKENPSENRYEREPKSKDYRNINPSSSVRHTERSNTTSDHKSYQNRASNFGYRTSERSGYYNNNKGSSSTKDLKDKVLDRKRRSNSYSSSDGESKSKKSKRDSERNKDISRKHRSNSYSSSDDESKYKKSKRDAESSHNSDVRPKHRDLPPDDRDRREGYKPGTGKFESDRRERKQGMSQAERAVKLAEMAAAGQEREVERGRRVARQRAEDAAAETARVPRSLTNEARALPDSLESRIKSNRHYIQRDKTHMNQHFARR